MIFVKILGLYILLQLDKTVKDFKVVFETSKSVKWPLSVPDCTDFYSIRPIKSEF